MNVRFYIPLRVGGLRPQWIREAMRPLQDADLGRALVIVHGKELDRVWDAPAPYRRSLKATFWPYTFAARRPTGLG
jgi:hypothetical protein